MPKRFYPLELHTFVAEHAAGTNDRDLTELINERVRRRLYDGAAG